MNVKQIPTAVCPRFHKAIEQIGSRWTGAIIAAITMGAHRFGELKSMVPGISDRMLADRLKELQVDGLVNRVVIPETPVRVEYHLTEKGNSLADVLDSISVWAEEWIDLDESSEELGEAAADD